MGKHPFLTVQALHFDKKNVKGLYRLGKVTNFMDFFNFANSTGK